MNCCKRKKKKVMKKNEVEVKVKVEEVVPSGKITKYKLQNTNKLQITMSKITNQPGYMYQCNHAPMQHHSHSPYSSYSPKV